MSQPSELPSRVSFIIIQNKYPSSVRIQVNLDRVMDIFHLTVPRYGGRSGRLRHLQVLHSINVVVPTSIKFLFMDKLLQTS